ncbi:hypothetical protein HX045_05525 [Myroides odoratimimus]|uniref:Lipoprotein n=1 Tax=Myroides odoratimimus CCUG 10230 TaxID=883150 RepID=A0ABP2N9I8_9FLAO|nr:MULTISPECIES: hypothetical protein [Myroides]AJA69979.1 hypothetical protein MYRA21_2870 [Myroides sp. A21]EHO08440.1 hypothetical protein HMPREF9712_02102 [Myroides odoratimimus CCUG 10230]MDM1442979.1 hypothetical protein [Myroides odoratimimus]MDM1448502.1 hypothetical protein [Myroides odoratimimus]MDM1453517.1 hypothetical protein [Myroides odoratimimus]
MKKIAMLFAFVATSLLVGCEGSTGPQGPPGPTMYPYVEEIKLSFTKDLTSTIQGQLIKHPNGFVDGDLVFVFIADKFSNDGKPLFSPLPTRYFVDVDKVEKELEYSYNYSPYDTEIVARANAPLGFFNGDGDKHEGFIKNMIFRIVYIPGSTPVIGTKSDNSKESEKTSLSYEEVVRKYNLEDVKVVKKY